MARFVEVFLNEIIELVDDGDEDLLTCPFSCPFSCFSSEFQASSLRPISSFLPMCCQQLMMWHVCVLKKQLTLAAVKSVTGGGGHSMLWALL